MKITGLEVYPVWGGFRNYLFVVVDTDEGIFGVGESGLTGRELAVAGVIEHLKPVLIGQDPGRIEHIWQYISRGAFFPAEGAVSAALSAIDIALWDIKGKALDVPIYELLGGLARDKVVCYPHNTGHNLEIEPLVESCLETKEAGLEVRALGLPAARESARTGRRGARVHRAVRGGSRGGRRRDRALLRCPHPARYARCV